MCIRDSSAILLAYVLLSRSFWENKDNFIAGIVLGLSLIHI